MSDTEKPLFTINTPHGSASIYEDRIDLSEDVPIDALLLAERMAPMLMERERQRRAEEATADARKKGMAQTNMEALRAAMDRGIAFVGWDLSKQGDESHSAIVQGKPSSVPIADNTLTGEDARVWMAISRSVDTRQGAVVSKRWSAAQDMSWLVVNGSDVYGRPRTITLSESARNAWQEIQRLLDNGYEAVVSGTQRCQRGRAGHVTFYTVTQGASLP